MTITTQLTTISTSEWVGTVRLNHTVLTAQAHSIAATAHAGVRRTAGDVYLDHPLRVAQRLQRAGLGEAVIAAAVLHDVLEDSPLGAGDLLALGIPVDIVQAVVAVSKRESERYSDLVARAAADPIGRWVKASDVLDNSSDAQLAPLPEPKRTRVEMKYRSALTVLGSVVDVQALAAA